MLTSRLDELQVLHNTIGRELEEVRKLLKIEQPVELKVEVSDKLEFKDSISS